MVPKRLGQIAWVFIGGVFCIPVSGQAAWLHTIDPYAIKLVEDGPIRWYGLSYLLGFVIAYLLIRRVVVAGVSTLGKQQVGDLVITVAIGIVLGGRLGYLVFYQPNLLWTVGDSFPYWDALALNQGGMASHGGMLGGLVGCVIYARRHGHSSWYLADLVVFGTPLGLFLGRLANFVNGELYGRPCDPQYLFAVRFPQEIENWSLQQLEAVYPAMPNPGKLIAAIQRGSADVIAAVEPHLTTRHPSQLYQALMEGLLLFLLLSVVWYKPRKPGVLFAWFCIGYALLRILGERFRMPDAHIGYQWLELTRGQWLCVPLLLGGILIWIGLQMRRANPMGSWRRQPTPTASDIPLAS